MIRLVLYLISVMLSIIDKRRWPTFPLCCDSFTGDVTELSVNRLLRFCNQNN